MLSFDSDTKVMKMIAKDTGDFIVSLDNYLLDEGDTVIFTVNDGYDKEPALIQKKITEFDNHTAHIRITSEDSDLTIGDYMYDIQINTADGRVDTVLGPAKFKIMGGITF